MKITDTIWQKGSELLGNYTIERKLGQGGMGAVHLVRRQMDDALFAVKTIRTSDLGSTQSKRTFLRELRTWVDFPDYPHLTRCCFFRTVDDRLAIFSEYVDGGSLKDWIKENKLMSTTDILDVAIQFAWSLQAVHDCSVVHQDVKPANVLMTRDGMVKVTDFGLSRTRPADLTGSAPGDSALISAAGMTAAYCSPEQSVSGKLDHRTDIWSYGISVMEMFTGPATWMQGVIASIILEQTVAFPGKTKRPPLPKPLADVLRKCFRESPAERWNSMNEIAAELIRLYRDETGSDYPRTQPDLPPARPRQKFERKTLHSGEWDNPMDWMDRVTTLTGKTCSKLDSLKAEQVGSNKTRALLDLEIFEELEFILKTALHGPSHEKISVSNMILSDGSGDDDNEESTRVMTTEAEPDETLSIPSEEESEPDQNRETSAANTDIKKILIELLREKAEIMMFVEDMPGAILIHDQRLDILASMPKLPGDWERESLEAKVVLSRASMLYHAGEFQEANTWYGRATEQYEKLMEDSGDSSHKLQLAHLYGNRGVTFYIMGKLEEAAGLYDRSIAIWKELSNATGESDYFHFLAMMHMNKSVTFCLRNRHEEAMVLFDEAIPIWERLINQEGRKDLLHFLAMMELNKANSLAAMKRTDEAFVQYDKAIVIWERLVNDEGKIEGAPELAKLYINKASTFNMTGKHKDALPLLNKAVDILEQRVIRDGRDELSRNLGSAYISMGETQSKLKAYPDAAGWFDKSIAILERLVVLENRMERAPDLAMTYYKQAELSLKRKMPLEAIAQCNQAMTLYKDLIKTHNREDLTKYVERCREFIDRVERQG